MAMTLQKSDQREMSGSGGSAEHQVGKIASIDWRTLVDAGVEACEVFEISPEIAAEMLQRNRDNYRSLATERLAHYVRQMTDGAWVFNSDTIKFSSDGDLLDGQHRLRAVIKANKTLRFMVAAGIDPAAKYTVDVPGSSRSLGDAVTHFGATTQSPLRSGSHFVASVYSAAVLYCRGVLNLPTNTKAFKFSPLDVANIATAWPTPVEMGKTMEAARKRAPRGVMSGANAFVIAAAFDHDEAFGNELLEGLSVGANLHAEHPTLKYRGNLISRADNRSFSGIGYTRDQALRAAVHWGNNVHKGASLQKYFPPRWGGQVQPLMFEGPWAARIAAAFDWTAR